MAKRLEDRLRERTHVTGECWIWTGRRNVDGYGILRVGRRICAAHRLAFFVSRGPIEEGLELDHLCCERACVRPSHLQPVSHAENVRRARTRAHERGHAIDPL